MKVPCIYKKTDSALRGNIGAELEAVAEESPDGQLFFVPAFPQMNRTTEHGQQLIEGMPVAQSVFGQDPFEPVRNSDVAAIMQSRAAAHRYGGAGRTHPAESPGIQICDAKSVEDIRRTGEVLRQNGKLRRWPDAQASRPSCPVCWVWNGPGQPGSPGWTSGCW